MMSSKMKPAKTKTTLDSSQRTSGPAGGKDDEVSRELQEKSHQDIDIVLKELETRLDGLSQSEADSRLKEHGPNEIVLLGLVLRFYQEMRAYNAAEKLKAMVSNTATVVRGGKEFEVPLKMLVPGDIIQLAAGDLVPADVRVLLAKDLFLNQSVLTGEFLPVEKKAASISEDNPNPLELPNICFMGSNVESGSATAVIVHTGDQTYFGSLAGSIPVCRGSRADSRDAAYDSDCQSIHCCCRSLAGHYTGVLCDSDPGSEDLVYTQVWRLIGFNP